MDRKEIDLLIKNGENLFVEFKEYELPKIKIEATSDSFYTSIYSNLEKVPEKTVEETVETTVEKILDAIAKDPKITQSELEKITGLTRRGVEWNISKLKQKGLLKRIGPAKGGHWLIKKGGSHE